MGIGLEVGAGEPSNLCLGEVCKNLCELETPCMPCRGSGNQFDCKRCGSDLSQIKPLASTHEKKHLFGTAPTSGNLYLEC